MQREVLDIWRRRVRTVIFVTHNIEEAVFLGDRILILSEKPAHIVADLPVPLEHPRDPLSNEFMRLRSECVHWLRPSHSAARASAGIERTPDKGREILADPQV
jgi:ABC-type nitrate/sulfonate/bicarbonate transport system ATPase subunit